MKPLTTLIAAVAMYIFSAILAALYLLPSDTDPRPRGRADQ